MSLAVKKHKQYLKRNTKYNFQKLREMCLCWPNLAYTLKSKIQFGLLQQLVIKESSVKCYNRIAEIRKSHELLAFTYDSCPFLSQRINY